MAAYDRAGEQPRHVWERRTEHPQDEGSHGLNIDRICQTSQSMELISHDYVKTKLMKNNSEKNSRLHEKIQDAMHPLYQLTRHQTRRTLS